jgi:hypothetical protein
MADFTSFSPETLMNAQVEASQNAPTEQPAQGDGQGETQSTGNEQVTGAAEGQDGAEQKPEGQDGTQGTEADSGQPDAKGITEKKPEWSEDERKMLESKGWKDVPYSESIKPIVKSYHEAEKRLSELGQSNGQAMGQLAEIATMLQAGDADGIRELAKSMGGDLSIERPIEDQVKEISSQYEATNQALEPVVNHIMQYANSIMGSNPDGAVLLRDAVTLFSQGISNIRGSAESKIAEIQRKQDLRSEITKITGVQFGNKSKAVYDKMKQNALNATTTLRQTDKEADLYLKELETVFGDGSPFAAAGLPLARALGHSPVMAQKAFEIGKALYFMKNQEKIKTDLYKGWEKEHEQRRRGAPPPSGGGLAQSQNTVNGGFTDVALQHMKSSGLNFNRR